MVKLSRIVWILYFLFPLFLIVYYVIVFGFGVELNLTPVVSMSMFYYFDSPTTYRLFVSAVGVYDFLTWGWLVKLTASLIGLILSILLLPVNILLAFIPTFLSRGSSLREVCRKTLNYIRFLLYARQPIPERGSMLTILGGWTFFHVVAVAFFIYTAQLTVVVPPVFLGMVPLSPVLQYVLLKVGDPAVLLPFVPLRMVRIVSFSGLYVYLYQALGTFSILLFGLVIVWLLYLIMWAAMYHKVVERNMAAFDTWLSSERKVCG